MEFLQNDFTFSIFVSREKISPASKFIVSLLAL